MIHRHRLAVVVAIFGCSLGASSMLFAAEGDAPTAAELLQQGKSQYQQGDLAAARQTLSQVDAAQLDQDQRVELSATIQDIDRQAAVPSDPALMLDKADAAVKAGDLTTAAGLYQQVVATGSTSVAQKELAKARLAQIRRQSLPADERMARQNLNDGVEDLQANRLDEAAAKLQAVKQSGVNLGWFDNQRLDRAMAVIDERRAAAAALLPPPVEPEPVAVVETPEVAQPVVETPVVEAPVVETPVAVAPTVETPVVETPVVETPVVEAPVVEAPVVKSDVLAQAMSLSAQEQLALAREAQAQNNYRLAVQHYQKALAIEPSNAQARAGLDDAQTRLQQSNVTEPKTLIGTEIKNMNVAGQAAIAEYKQMINLAQSQRKALNYTASVESVQQAKIILDNNVRLLPASEYRRLRDQANQLATVVNDEKIRFTEAEAQRNAEIQANKTAEAAAAAIQQQDMEVQNLLRRANALRKEQSYTRALQLVNRALFLDRNNYAAQAMKDIIEDSIILTGYHATDRATKLARSKLSVDNAEAAIPPTSIIEYPVDWPQITKTRLGANGQEGADSEANRIVAQKLREPIPAEFQANQLETAINFIRQITGVNILVKWSAMQLVGVERDTPISLQLTNVPASQALRYILQDATSRVGTNQNPITFAIFDGLVQISTEEDLKSTTTYAKVYDIRDLLIQVPNFEDAPEFNLTDVLSNDTSTGGSNTSGGGGGGGTSLFGDSNDSATDGPSRGDVIQQIRDLIQSTVGKPEDWPNSGGLLSSITELNGNLIIRTTPSNHRAIIELLGQLRETRAMQISIEARFLLVDRQFVNDFGVDFDININNIGSKFGPISIAQNSFPATDVASALTGGNPALALGASFLSDVEVNLVIRATQADQRSVQLTAPRITLFNGQRSFVLISTQTSFVSGLEPIPDTLGFNPEVSVVQEGILLDVEGTISADRRYVTMTVRPNLSRLVDLVSVPFTTGTAIPVDGNNNNNNGGTLFTTGSLQLPILELNTLRTTVSVPDQGTILLGGQRVVNEREIEVGVPVLSKIPFINRLFTNRSVDKLDRTLLILIKPTIIIQSEEEDKLFRGLNADPGQYNQGRILN